MYLTSEYKSIRLEAVKTCTFLLIPALLPTSIFTTPFVQFSAASAQVVSDVLRKLLTVGITDTGKEGEKGRERERERDRRGEKGREREREREREERDRNKVSFCL